MISSSREGKWGSTCRSSTIEVNLGKGVQKICSKLTGEHPCRNMISMKLPCNFIDIALWHECSPVNLLHTFRTPFYKNTPGGAASVHVNYMQNYFQLFSGNCFSKYCIYTGVCVPWPSALDPRSVSPRPSFRRPSAQKYCKTKYNATI